MDEIEIVEWKRNGSRGGHPRIKLYLYASFVKTRHDSVMIPTKQACRPHRVQALEFRVLGF